MVFLCVVYPGTLIIFNSFTQSKVCNDDSFRIYQQIIHFTTQIIKHTSQCNNWYF